MAMATVQVATAKPKQNHRDNRQGERNGNRGLSHYLAFLCLIADLLGTRASPHRRLGANPALAPNLPKTLNVGDA